jgi:excisionase family DNA binding protein
MPNTDKFFNSKESLVLTVPEVAKILRVSPGTVYNAVKRGDLPHINIGKRVIVPRVQLERWLEQQNMSNPLVCSLMEYMESINEKAYPFFLCLTNLKKAICDGKGSRSASQATMR